jgi:hypothetical protein
MTITRDTQSPSIVRSRGRKTNVADAVLCRLLDRTPSERSEDKLVFLINVRTFVLFAGTRVQTSRRAFPLPSGWALMMRAIKCLKGVRWMPWR